MTLAGLLVFSAAYALAVASPGPGTAAIVAQVLGRGLAAAPAFILGMLTGDLIWFVTASLGLTALAQAYSGIFVFIKWAGIAYLVFLAWKMWTSPMAPAGAEAPVERTSQRHLYLSALTLTLGNPKAIAFFVALLPSIIDMERLTLAGFAEVALLIAVILPGVLMIYAGCAHAARGLFKSTRALRNLNRLSGTAIAAAAATIATRS